MALTHAALDQRGIVDVGAAALVEQASRNMGRPVSPDVYALARMIASEVSPSHPDTAPLRVHVALNDLADLNARHHFGWTAEDLILYSTMPIHRGHFGEQEHGRRYASTNDPLPIHVLCVEHAMADHANGIDPTGGALKFVDVKSMGKQHGSGKYDALVADWAKERLVPFTLEGYDGLVVFRRQEAA